MVGSPLPERPRCGHASLWWKPRLYQELEGPTASSLWGQAAMGLRCGMRTTKCQLLVTSLCVMVSRQVWGDLCRTEVNRCLCHSRSERGWFSHVLFLAGGGQAQPTARVIIAPWAVIAGHQHRPPPLIDFWFLRAVTPLQLFHNSAAASKEKEKVAAGRMGGSQQKDICSCLLGAKERGQTCCSHTCCWEGG